MGDIVVKKAGELECYQGEGELEGIRFRMAAKELGVTAWGMSVMDIAPNCTLYPEHDHLSDGQQEVYVVLSGAAKLIAGGDERQLEAGMLVFVPPDRKRKFVTGSSSAVLLAIGATPGRAFAPRVG